MTEIQKLLLPSRAVIKKGQKTIRESLSKLRNYFYLPVYSRSSLEVAFSRQKAN